ncbi:aldehyde dehydrogenase [Subtercola lobariae]|uniref:Aldehyde dehydrogenase n=1 Tax=Subtercola lobariae TaxID=1588641 RepID=A0A917BA36_9MICO|nr:aldehyde dehydrogenase [Subtercola lobariae]GGF32884.1 aldehyde dehydrogenase [Subtercola lobariae]
MPHTAVDHRSLFIGGEWVAPHSTTRISVRSANTGEIIGGVPSADQSDIYRAVAAARRAFDDPTGWSTWAPSERTAVLARFAEALDRRADLMAETISVQNGMPIFLSKLTDSRFASQLLSYYAALAESGDDEEMRASSSGGRTLVRKVAVGVVAAIVPWNFPNIMAALKYAPAFAAGCTVVIKPSPETVLDAILVAEAAAEAGFPPGVINIVSGGAQTGIDLVEHPDVDKVSFTGSTATGRAIGEISGRLLRPVTLELGGKSAAIILDDANLDMAAIGAQFVPALFANNGQTCFLTSRVLAPRSRYDEVVDVVTRVARSLRVGDSLDPQTQIGPLVSERQRNRVEALITGAIADGARLTAGGGRPAGQEAGWFVEPTVLADVDNASEIAQEEIFGPVVTITPYDDDDHAVRLANDSHYGLAGSIWTTHHSRGIAIAKRLVTGTVGINGYEADVFSPTTMIKASGIGVKFGPEALASYQRYQSVYL